jgi:hypothetical protein
MNFSEETPKFDEQQFLENNAILFENLKKAEAKFEEATKAWIKAEETLKALKAILEPEAKDCPEEKED